MGLHVQRSSGLRLDDHILHERTLGEAVERSLGIVCSQHFSTHEMQFDFFGFVGGGFVVDGDAKAMSSGNRFQDRDAVGEIGRELDAGVRVSRHGGAKHVSRSFHVLDV